MLEAKDFNPAAIAGTQSKSFIQNPAAPRFRGGVATAGTQSKSLNRKIYFCKRSIVLGKAVTHHIFSQQSTATIAVRLGRTGMLRLR